MKTFLAAIAATILTAAATADPASLTIRADKPGAAINKNVYGQFSEMLGTGINGGIYVGEDSPIPNTRGLRNDVIAALKDLKVPLVRWPGGCFADYYHWRDGVGPKDKRGVQINGWGDVTENNAFGTHEFFDFVEQIGAEAYVNANAGTGSPQEAADWLEYITGVQDTEMVKLRKANGRDKPWKLAVYAIGNETWGCGGNMRPEYYADLYNQYATFLRTPQNPRPVYLASGDRDGSVVDFTTVLMGNRRAPMEAISMHYYTILGPQWNDKDTATGFSEAGWINTLAQTVKMDGFIKKHDLVMSAFEKKQPAATPNKKIGLYIDEWGTWYKPEPGTNSGFLVQQNSLRDAIVAAVNLNIFHKYADRVQMTSIAQTINVLQAMILTDGPKMVLTPTYHVFRMYKPFQEAASLPVTLKTGTYKYGKWSVPQVSASAAKTKDGTIVIGLANLDPHNAADIAAVIAGAHAGSLKGEILTASAMDAHNSFERTDAVRPAAFDGASFANGKLKAVLPPKSVVVLTIQ